MGMNVLWVGNIIVDLEEFGEMLCGYRMTD
jgi:hypothetical protein